MTLGEKTNKNENDLGYEQSSMTILMFTVGEILVILACLLMYSAKSMFAVQLDGGSGLGWLFLWVLVILFVGSTQLLLYSGKIYYDKAQARLSILLFCVGVSVGVMSVFFYFSHIYRYNRDTIDENSTSFFIRFLASICCGISACILIRQSSIKLLYDDFNITIDNHKTICLYKEELMKYKHLLTEIYVKESYLSIAKKNATKEKTIKDSGTYIGDKKLKKEYEI